VFAGGAAAVTGDRENGETGAAHFRRAATVESNRPTYLDCLVAICATRRATRPAVEVERLLAACKHCPRWTPDGCSAMTPREFAVMLADANGRCRLEPIG